MIVYDWYDIVWSIHAMFSMLYMRYNWLCHVVLFEFCLSSLDSLDACTRLLDAGEAK